MSQQVESILQQIEQLDQQDRLLLEQRLHEMEEAEWQHEAAVARGHARQQGIDQDKIDEAINDLRYGS